MQKPLIVAFVLSVLLAACGKDPATEPSQVPDDSSALAAWYTCSAWFPKEPSEPTVLADVLFSDNAIGEPSDRPLERHRQRIREAGGTIVFEYHVTMIRAMLPVSGIPSLRANSVRVVRDDEPYVVQISVRFRAPVTDEDIEWLEALGGVQIRRSLLSNWVSATVADDVLPLLRRDPRVDLVDSTAFACAG